MGPVDARFHFAKDRPTVIMLCGLQGSGKTTTAGKLALPLRDRLGRKPCWSRPTCSAPPPSSNSKCSANN